MKYIVPLVVVFVVGCIVFDQAKSKKDFAGEAPAAEVGEAKAAPSTQQCATEFASFLKTSPQFALPPQAVETHAPGAEDFVPPMTMPLLADRADEQLRIITSNMNEPANAQTLARLTENEPTGVRNYFEVYFEEMGPNDPPDAYEANLYTLLSAANMTKTEADKNALLDLAHAEMEKNYATPGNPWLRRYQEIETRDEKLKEFKAPESDRLPASGR